MREFYSFQVLLTTWPLYYMNSISMSELEVGRVEHQRIIKLGVYVDITPSNPNFDNNYSIIVHNCLMTTHHVAFYFSYILLFLILFVIQSLH